MFQERRNERVRQLTPDLHPGHTARGGGGDRRLRPSFLVGVRLFGGADLRMGAVDESSRENQKDFLPRLRFLRASGYKVCLGAGKVPSTPLAISGRRVLNQKGLGQEG